MSSLVMHRASIPLICAAYLSATRSSQQLRGKRTASHACRVGLRNTQDFLHVFGANTETGANAARGAAAGGHVRVSTMIDIQHGALRTFKQEALSFANGFGKKRGAIANIFCKLAAKFIDSREEISRIFAGIELA